ncbi:MAG: phosphoribosylaminoimidazolesuccinocarboxamide synthase [Lentisphaerota bacterium]
MDSFRTFFTPQLKRISKGKVRDSYTVDKKNRMIVVTDRISAFDVVLDSAIPGKGAVLNGMTNFWFEMTKDVIPNHFIKEIDPNISLVKTAMPIKLEMVVRGFITGSMWRGYEKGKRVFSGVKVGEGLKQNIKLQSPILTPTTKSKNDEEISKEEILAQKIIDKETYEKIESAALGLYSKASDYLISKGILLVDTKYEFGIIDGNLTLIDEIHTPDSSRYWDVKDYESDPKSVYQMDKEYVRAWLIRETRNGVMPIVLSDEVIKETSKRYREIYEKVTGKKFTVDISDCKNRMYRNLSKSGLIKDGYVSIVMGSASDKDHAQKIQSVIQRYDIMSELRVVSAHKNGEKIIDLAREYNDSIEPGAIIAIAGKSNGLGGALASNMNIPVINCPKFTTEADMIININSSLMMPSKVPSGTILDPENAALFALRTLNINRLRETFDRDIVQIKDKLSLDDINLKEQTN